MTGEPSPGNVAISEIRDPEQVDDALVAAFARLIPQLSSSSPPPDAAALREIVTSPTTALLVATSDGAVVGSLTLVTFRVPTGVLAWIEDVVVDEGRRGAGGGGALVTAALRRAVHLGAKHVDLTSRPSREAANRLYRRMGFETRETNIYRWKPPAASPGGG